MSEALRLSQLADMIRRVLSLNFPKPIWVEAEVAQARESRGHLYLQLIDKSPDSQETSAQMEAVLWQTKRKELEKQWDADLGPLLQEGNQVQLQVRLEHHALYGFKLLIEQIDLRFSLGQMALRRRQIIDSLIQEGLFDRNRATPFPTVVQRVAAISSPQAAGWLDFRNQLAHNPWGYAFAVTLFPAAMQGTALEDEVCERLREVADHSDSFDVCTIIRGGGSKTDLAWFDNRRIAETIAHMPIPVLTGIGHDIDETVSDLVAWKALKTPTALAAWLIEHDLQFESRLLETARLIRDECGHRTQQAGRDLYRTASDLRMAGKHAMESARWKLDLQKTNLSGILRLLRERQEAVLERRELAVAQLDPAAVLKRGYSITLWDGQPVQDPQQVPVGGTLETILLEGRILSQKLPDE